MALGIALNSGCTNSKKEFVPPEEIARRQSEVIINSVKRNDPQALKGVFCSALKNKDNLDNEINDFFKFIDGEIVSHDPPWGYTDTEKIRPLETILLGASGKIRKIVTDHGVTYTISFCSYQINKGHDEYIGVFSLSIFNEDTYDSNDGYPPHGYKKIEVKPEEAR